MENTRKGSRKIILFVLLVLLIGLIGIGAYSYFSFNTNKNTSINNINVSSGRIYPEYSSDVKEYQLYTDSDEVIINCDLLGDNVEGCNEKVSVSEKFLNYEITAKEKGQDVKYVIKIVKQDTNYSEIIKINNIEGVPNSWVKSTTIKVNIDNEKEIEGITYSFDGGKTWSDSNSIEIKDNTTLQILAKDYFGYVTKTEIVTVDKIDNDKPSVALSKKSLGNGKVLLTATAVDEGSLVSGYNWNDKGYNSSNTLEVDKAGTYFVVVNDKVGNESEKVTIQVTEDNLKDPNEKEFVAVFDNNGADSISAETLKCTTKGTSCIVKAPSITRKDYTILGWSTNSNATNAEIQVGSDIHLTGEKKYYAVTAKRISATFNKNGADSIGSEHLSCNIYNNQTSCSIVAPNIKKIGYSVAGWSINNSASAAEVKVGEKIVLSQNKNFYAITYNKATISFNKNGAKNISSNSLSCYMYNGQSSCTVTLPTITAASGFEVIGWGNSASSTSKVASVNQKITINKNASYYAVTKSKDAYKATFNKNGASSISASSLSCYRYNGSTSCIITTPTITPKSGFNVVGWGNSASSISKVASANQKVSINKNINYYAVTKSSDYYKITFNKNGASSVGASSLSCYRYNNQSSCTVTLPTITAASGFEAIGWGNSASSTSKVASVGQQVKLDKNTTYYAVTKSKDYYKVTFWPRTASIGNYSIGTGIVRSCYRYNAQPTCSVTTPDVNLSSKQQFLGWTTNTGATSSNIKSNQTISLKANASYYAIIKETLTLTFNKNGANSISTSKVTCTSYGTGCTITDTASINKPGYEIWGFSTSSNSGYGSVINRKIYQDSTWYARAYNNYRKKPLNVATSYKVNGIYIDVEKSSSLSYSTYNTYYNFIKKVSTKMPYLYDSKGKITMMSNSTFANTWGTGWAGMAYGVGEYSSNDVKLSSTVSEYSKGTFVHEQGHNFDAYYGIKTGTSLSSQSDIKALYNKYKTQSSSKRPMRDYAYTNEREFVAEAIEYYYYYKYETVKCPNGGNQITSDIIKTFEKYFNIAKNGYK